VEEPDGGKAAHTRMVGRVNALQPTTAQTAAGGSSYQKRPGADMDTQGVMLPT
jgi:hypothetical protein